MIKHPSNSQMKTPQDISDMIYVVEFWDKSTNPLGVSVNEWKRIMKKRFGSQVYKWEKNYKVEYSNGPKNQKAILY